ncbi:hypothetical protein AVEN_31655-1 [Araneus ventricosus]|uniref:Uncharacterized protein n=1 Tax=Araneus ventricosus TaxID=182803 RepID=A0A4Y2X2W1_ARAVE|nr:hypothetical protein AVEN_31655-1 [Araneus ventricosus]
MGNASDISVPSSQNSQKPSRKREFLLATTCENCNPIPSFQKQWGSKKKKRRPFFKDVMHRFLEVTKDPLYIIIVQRMLTAYEAQGCTMSLKVHFLHSHIVKSRVKDFTRVSVIPRGDTKDDGTSKC